MFCLKWIYILILSQLILLLAVQRERNKFGLFVPRIDNADRADSVKKVNSITDMTAPTEVIVPADEVPMDNLRKVFDNLIPTLTYIDPQHLNNVDDVFNFRLVKFKVRQRELYSIKLHEKNLQGRSYLDTSAYWCRQGKYVDIPIHPSTNDPKYLFTPPFSGCALVVDQIDSERYRVYHVEGGKHDAQYNNLRDHGLGQVTTMEYKDYGYHSK